MKRYTLISTAITAVAVLTWGGMVSAESFSSKSLPREFHKARLGMAMEELVQLAPQAVKSGQDPGKPSERAVRVPSKDPYVQYSEYRFFDGRLYEQAIYYRRNRIPRGYPGLVDRLREVYGRPAREDVQEWDPDADSLSSQKTVWKDASTRIALAELRKMREGREYYELVLTMTDLGLEEARERAADARIRAKAMQVPIPLPDGSSDHKYSASSSDRLPAVSHRS